MATEATRIENHERLLTIKKYRIKKTLAGIKKVCVPKKVKNDIIFILFSFVCALINLNICRSFFLYLRTCGRIKKIMPEKTLANNTRFVITSADTKPAPVQKGIFFFRISLKKQRACKF